MTLEDFCMTQQYGTSVVITMLYLVKHRPLLAWSSLRRLSSVRRLWISIRRPQKYHWYKKFSSCPTPQANLILLLDYACSWTKLLPWHKGIILIFKKSFRFLHCAGSSQKDFSSFWIPNFWLNLGHLSEALSKLIHAVCQYCVHRRELRIFFLVFLVFVNSPFLPAAGSWKRV